MKDLPGPPRHYLIHLGCTVTNGKLVGMHHWQSKANVEQNIRNLGIPATFFLAGFFMQTLSTAFFRQDKASNTWTLQMPFAANTPMPLIDAATDTGKYVKSILHQREKMLGKRILAAADYYTAQEVVDVFVEAKPEAGKGASYKEVSPAIFRAYLRDDLGFGEGAQDELLENMQLLSEFGYFGGADLAESNSVSHSRPSVENGNAMCKTVELLTTRWIDLDRQVDQLERFRS